MKRALGHIPLNGLKWSLDSGSALYDTPKTAIFGRAGGGKFDIATLCIKQFLAASILTFDCKQKLA